MDKLERRTVNLSELRITRQTDEEKCVRMIEGHAAVFNQWSEELGGWFPFREKVLPGAFAETIKTDDIRALFNHDANCALGRNKAGTLFLEEDDTGLKVRILPPDTQWAKDLLVSIERGDVSQMSFGFTVLSDRWGTEKGADVRELVKGRLYDVSPVTFPAYPQTDVGVRSALEAYERHRSDVLEAEKAKNEQKLTLIKRKLEVLRRV
ncbi:MAG: HK97 family phage prohead protease [Peptococcaceae bacterium]|jgi:HK97 family phage prohead protease|nr:HK97 family phage prohead protease [Peptococcaceae bacterium]MDH7526243.1 HK97 family phage prohead protease [Peptococcaceae bacterium]